MKSAHRTLLAISAILLATGATAMAEPARTASAIGETRPRAVEAHVTPVRPDAPVRPVAPRPAPAPVAAPAAGTASDAVSIERSRSVLDTVDVLVPAWNRAPAASR